MFNAAVFCNAMLTTLISCPSHNFRSKKKEASEVHLLTKRSNSSSDLANIRGVFKIQLFTKIVDGF